MDKLYGKKSADPPGIPPKNLIKRNDLIFLGEGNIAVITPTTASIWHACGHGRCQGSRYEVFSGIPVDSAKLACETEALLQVSFR